MRYNRINIFIINIFTFKSLQKPSLLCPVLLSPPAAAAKATANFPAMPNFASGFRSKRYLFQIDLSYLNQYLYLLFALFILFL